MVRRSATVLVALFACASVRAEEPSLEYRVKAAYLYNFVKFVEWPANQAAGPLTICIAGRNPFGSVLADAVHGESVGGRPLAVRAVGDNAAGCQVLFVPHDVPPAGYLRAVRSMPTLTVGEAPDFLARGGIINFVVDGGKVRFDINPDAAGRMDLKISSRLLRLAHNEPRD